MYGSSVDSRIGNPLKDALRDGGMVLADICTMESTKSSQL